MKTLKIEESTALKLYKTANDAVKTILEETFGKEFFKLKSIIDKVKNFDDILELAGYSSDLEFLEDKGVSRASEKTKNIERLQLIEEVYAEGWKRNWNGRQYHYYPYFNISGLLSVAGFLCDCDYSGGSLAYFENSEKALDAGTKFINIYKDILK